MELFSGVDTLLFDMDGTIIDLTKRWWNPFLRALHHLKPELDERNVVLEFEQQMGNIINAVSGNSRFINVRMFWKITAVLRLSLLERIKLLQLLWKDPKAFREIQPVKGAENTIQILHNRGYTLALVTSASNRTARLAKDQLGFFDKFSLVVTRDMVDQVKPHPEALLLACDKLSKESQQCVMIGDFPQDIKAGKRAGTKTIAVLGLNRRFTEDLLNEQQPDAVIEQLETLLEILPGIKHKG